MWLDPGQSETVTLDLDARDFAYWNVDQHDWVVEPGDFELRIGPSSRDIQRNIPITIA